MFDIRLVLIIVWAAIGILVLPNGNTFDDRLYTLGYLVIFFAIILFPRRRKNRV